MSALNRRRCKLCERHKKKWETVRTGMCQQRRAPGMSQKKKKKTGDKEKAQK